MAWMQRSGPVALIDELARPLDGPGNLRDYDPLIERVGERRIVLLGEATHGTHEFYRARARITERLIREKGFDAILVEADWPDAYRVNRYVRWQGDSRAHEALAGFQRFPQWMWRNADVLELVHMLRDQNERRDPEERVGFYGLDLYSLHSSMRAVVQYLKRVDPQAARAAEQRYACFDAFGDDVHTYGRATSTGLAADCEQAVVAELSHLRQNAWRYLMSDGVVAQDEQFSAEQNALVAMNGERYYREMYRGEASSWNLRDTHMADTLDALITHIERRKGDAKVVVWAHNSHLGDARATGMSRRGELNVGQLVRERHASDALLVGFSTYDGTVAAASEWDGPVFRKDVLPAREGSVEELMHRSRHEAFILDLAELPPEAGLSDPRLERAIGVIYRPETELFSHYFQARVSEQFDLLIHFDRTRAVDPLERRPGWETRGEWPETYPTGV
jgi:erythromycin esterase-like protein